MIDFPETGFKWNQTGLLAQKFYTDYETLSYPDLMARFAQANADITALVESFGNDELYGQAWYGKWTRGRMIQFNTSSPYKNARGRVRQWLKAKRDK